LIDTSQKLFTS